VGNSSSGLVEAPSFGVPAVNIGNRQQNRLAGESVIHSRTGAEAIEAAIRKAVSPRFQAFARTCRNPYDPYGDGRGSERILHALLAALAGQSRERLLTKVFARPIRPADWNLLLLDFK
jgi:UDP-N-acetylglucosamine 2-epimerase